VREGREGRGVREVRGVRGVLVRGAVLMLVLGSAVGRAATTEGRAPERLSETGFFTLAKRPFSPQYPLWTDGAAKSRWVYLPAGATIDGRDENAWNFPIGTKFWKDFAFDGRTIETRFLWKVSNTRWVAASYVWNEQRTDAVRAPEEGVPNAAELAPGRGHSIPSTNDCRACHGSTTTRVLGFDPLQLSPDRDPNAIHGEPLGAGMVTLETLIKERSLTGARVDIVSKPPRIATDDPDTRRVLGYLAGNCAHCHNGNGEIAALGPVLKYEELVGDADAVKRAIATQPTKWQVPGVPEGASMLVNTHAPETSALLVRMRSRRPSSQMPPLGTVIRDQQAVDAIAAWISRGD
jgi:mono/diheme cytochrome c family protein